MADDDRRSPSEEVKRLYEESESRAAKAVEKAVSGGSFAELLARMTENVVGLTKIGTDVFDLMLRNLRLAGRQDITRLARQLARTEDKLELVLQEVERLREELPSGRGSRSARSRSSPNGARGSGTRSGQGSRQGSR